MKKIITTVTLFLNLFIYSQNVGEQFFTEMLQYAEIEFQEMEDFTPIKVENKEPSYCYHPVLGCFYIMHKSFNKEKDVYAVYEVIPEKIDGKLIFKERPRSLPVYEADVDIGSIFYIDKNILKDKYNATEGVSCYVKMRKRLDDKYALCKEVYIEKEDVGSIRILLLYNKENEWYIKDLISHMYLSVRFKE